MVLYVSNSCPSCRILYGSPLIEGVSIRNIDQDPTARRDLFNARSSSVPTLVVGTSTISGARPILDYLAAVRFGRK